MVSFVGTVLMVARGSHFTNCPSLMPLLSKALFVCFLIAS